MISYCTLNTVYGTVVIISRQIYNLGRGGG